MSAEGRTKRQVFSTQKIFVLQALFLHHANFFMSTSKSFQVGGSEDNLRTSGVDWLWGHTTAVLKEEKLQG